MRNVNKFLKLMTMLVLFISCVSQAEDLKCNSKFDWTTEKIVLNVKNESTTESYKLNLAISNAWEQISGAQELSRTAISPNISLAAGESISLNIEPSSTIHGLSLLYVQLHTLSNTNEHVDFFCDNSEASIR